MMLLTDYFAIIKQRQVCKRDGALNVMYALHKKFKGLNSGPDESAKNFITIKNLDYLASGRRIWF